MDRCSAISIPYPGALPHVAAIDHRHCLRTRGEPCTQCRDACPFDAIDYDQTETRFELAVGAVVVATGFQSFDPNRDGRYGHGKLENVITATAFERLVNTSGPTGGKIVTADGLVPQQVAFVYCVGSRTDAANGYCSGLCCLTSIKQAHQVKQQLPETVVHHIYADFCLTGKSGQRLFNRHLATQGVVLHRMECPGAVRIDRQKGIIRVHVTEPGGRVEQIEADLVILATALEPAMDARQTAECLDIDLDADGFFKEHHPVSAPVQSSREGIYLAGCSQGPKDIPSSVAQGQAAAGCILQTLVPGGKITLDPIVAQVNTDLCSGCLICEGGCPFGALTHDQDKSSVCIEAALCRGCGICAATCPCGAIAVNHYGRDVVYAELTGLIRPSGGQAP
jgi:heterodisulfide reductase subunit A